MAVAGALTVFLAALAALSAPAPSAAAPAPPRPVIDQYVEQIPTAEGPAPPDTEREPGALPTEVRRQVDAEAGSEADALTAIATSPRYGAPKRAAPAATPEPSTGTSTDQSSPDEEQGDARPSTEAIESGDVPTLPRDTRLVALFLAMVASLVAATGYGIVRSRGR